MKLLDAISFFLFTLIFSVNCYAQNLTAEHKVGVQIPEVALLSLQAESGTDVNFSTTAPNIAGNRINIAQSSSGNLWLNYSSVIQPNQRRKITALVQGNIPDGLKLKLQASESTGNGVGSLGLPTGSVELNNQPTDIISNIGSCYTGQGVQNGHQLNYLLEFDSDNSLYKQFSKKQASVSIIYTLTDEN